MSRDPDGEQGGVQIARMEAQSHGPKIFSADASIIYRCRIRPRRSSRKAGPSETLLSDSPGGIYLNPVFQELATARFSDQFS